MLQPVILSGMQWSEESQCHRNIINQCVAIIPPASRSFAKPVLERSEGLRMTYFDTTTGTTPQLVILSGTQ